MSHSSPVPPEYPPLTNQPLFLPGDERHACLLLHGLGGGAYEMQWLGQYLNGRGLTVQTLLYPGHDQRARQMPRSQWQDWYAHILKTYQTLAQQYAQISIIGFSTGCPLGLYLATQQPVYKLVLLAPYLRLRSYWYYGLPLETYLNTLGRVIADVPRFRLPTADPTVEPQARAAAFFSTFNLAAVRSAMELIEIVKPKLPTLHNPALIIQSPLDSVVDPKGASFLYDTLGSTLKELVWLKQSDHIMTLDRERETVFQRVGDFLCTSTANDL